MARHAAFLKGMNVGGRRITNDELRSAVEALGLRDVETFRASGNFVFESGRRDEQALQRLIEKGLREQLGYEVATFVRSSKEIGAILATEPFTTSELDGAGKLQVCLLASAPPANVGREAVKLADERERLSLDGRELYWLPAGGVSDTTLDWKALDRLVGPMTVRTMGTIEQMAAKLLDEPAGKPR